MARKTKGALVSDLELRLTEGKPSDDLEFEREQLAHWLDQAANMILSDYITKQMLKREDINPEYIKSSLYRNPIEEGITEVAAADERYYIDISGLEILPPRGFRRDYGVVRVHDQYNRHMVNITYDESDYFDDLWYAKSDKDSRNFQWYREGGRVYIKGIDSTNYTTESFRVFYIEVIDSSLLADIAEYPLGEDLSPLVVDIAEEIGWRQLKDGLYDDQNDGNQMQ